MKRFMSVLLSILLAIGVAFSFTGCSKDDEDGGKKDKEKTSESTASEDAEDEDDDKPDSEKIVGKWEGGFDYTDAVNEGFSGELGDDSVKLCTDAVVPYVFNFKSDGSFTMKFDSSKENDFEEDMEEQFKEGLKDYFTKAAEDEGGNIDDFVKEEGYNDLDDFVDDFVDEELDVEDTLSPWEELSISGYYKISGDKLYVAETEDDLEDAEEYFKFNIKGSKLTFTSCSEPDVFGTFPVTFKKA